MTNQELCNKLIEKVREVMSELNVPFIEGSSDNRFESHKSFKKSPKRTYCYVQFSNKQNTKDHSNICFRFLPQYDHKTWFTTGDYPALLQKWKNMLFKHWSEEENYPDHVRDIGKGTQQYALEIKEEDLRDGKFNAALAHFISMAVTSVNRDVITFESLIK